MTDSQTLSTDRQTRGESDLMWQLDYVQALAAGGCKGVVDLVKGGV